MTSRAAQLIDDLGLAPHPEGGYFREIYRSASNVRPDDGRGDRAAMTSIYFLLTEGDVSRWHCVVSDEVWQHYEGAAIELVTADAGFTRVDHHTLRPNDAGGPPVHVVRAGTWQAARSLGAYTLVGCTVGPGFDFADFSMLRNRPSEVDAERLRQPDVAGFL